MDDRIELRLLRYFVAVAEELHFGRAARRLHIAQPPLSRQIRQLEGIVGHQLFERTSRAVRLTSAGAALLERTRRTLDRINEDVAEVRRIGRGESGSLTVGFVSSAMLTRVPAILRRYRSAYPKVELKLREMYTSNLAEAVGDGSVDVGFLRDGGPIDGLQVELVLAEPYIVILPKAHRLARLQAIPVEQLRDEAFVLFPPSVGRRAWEKTELAAAVAGFRLHVAQEAPQWVTILRLVGAGMGITIAPECIRSLAWSDVVCRRLKPAGGTSDIELAFRAGQTTPTTNAFCELARSAFRGR